MRASIARLPVFFDDFPLYRSETTWGAWETDALREVAARDTTVFGLHDCYAHLWLDRYEGFPSYYIKEECTVRMTDGSEIKGMIYLMNQKRVAPPTRDYYEGIRRAYLTLGFRSEIEKVLEPALLRSLARTPR